jgi:uncharacterized membrane protein (UPF0127 family)
MKCINVKTGEVLADKLVMKDGLLGRMVGLLSKNGLAPGEGIILKPCVQIHTFFRRFPIDVVFLNADMRVIHVIENMRAWRVSPMLPHASRAVELAAGRLAGKVKEGDRLVFKD